MNSTKLQNLDLNLLLVFDALFEERSVTRAAQRLHLTPSAVSHALNKLRYRLNDALFVRGANGMQPTVLAADIGAKVQVALHGLQAALTPSEFRAGETKRQFKLSATPYTCWLLLPHLMPRFKREAPNAGIAIHRSAGLAVEELDAGVIDLAIGVFDQVPDRFEAEPLLSDRLVWVMRAGNPAASSRLTLKALAKVPHVIMAPFADPDSHGANPTNIRRAGLNDQGRLDAALARHGLSQTVGVIVPDALSALAITAASDFATLAPYRFAAAFAESHKLKLFDPPYACPEVKFSILWRRDPYAGPSVAWLRSVLLDVAAAL